MLKTGTFIFRPSFQRDNVYIILKVKGLLVYCVYQKTN